MAETMRLRGMAWDHPRAVDPLHAISAAWSANRDVEVTWDARPLKDFEDQPLEELATRYDLILIDYPFVGFAAASGLLVPVDKWVDSDYLDDQRNGSVGPSYASYTWTGHQWALAVDAACQVSAVRPDLLTEHDLPATWEDVSVMAAAGRRDGPCVAMPLNPNHAYCAFLSVGLSLAGPDFWSAENGLESKSAREALEFLRALADELHPLSRDADPIRIADRMTATDEIGFVPLMFGYSNYSRPGFRAHRIRFGDAPLGTSGHIGSVLGGVGIALSAKSRAASTAADLARLIASRETQCGLYVASGGQPGHAAAWESSAANELVDNFFYNTRRTIEQAFLRPRVTGHRRFQVLAGELVHRFLWQRDIDAGTCLANYEELAASLLPAWGDGTTNSYAGVV